MQSENCSFTSDLVAAVKVWKSVIVPPGRAGVGTKETLKRYDFVGDENKKATMQTIPAPLGAFHPKGMVPRPVAC